MKYLVFSIKHKKLLLWYIVLFILCTTYYVLHTPVPAGAQESIRTITIVPPTVSQTLNAGEISEGKMKVINDSNGPLTFSASVADFIVSDTQGTPNLLPPNTLSKKYSAAAWIGVTPDTFTVAPHQKQELNYFIQVPADARPGGHYAAVVYSPLPSGSVEGTGASVETKMGTLFYIAVDGPINEQARVSKFSAPSFQEYGPVDILTNIKNLSDLHIRPAGTIVIYDFLGRKIDSQALMPVNIFPQASRDYKNTLGAKIMIGRFKANLLAGYGRKNNLPLLATVYFWVFPWRIVLVLILIIVAAVLGWKYWRKKKAKVASI